MSLFRGAGQAGLVAEVGRHSGAGGLRQVQLGVQGRGGVQGPPEPPRGRIRRALRCVIVARLVLRGASRLSLSHMHLLWPHAGPGDVIGFGICLPTLPEHLQETEAHGGLYSPAHPSFPGYNAGFGKRKRLLRGHWQRAAVVGFIRRFH